MAHRTLLMLGWVAVTGLGCAGTNLPTPTSSTAGSTGGAGVGGASTGTGSSGAVCTDDFTGVGSPSTAPLVGACVNFDYTCGGIVCTEILGSSNLDFYNTEKSTFLQTFCPGWADGSMSWQPGGPCSDDINDLAGGCETNEGPTGTSLTLTASWYSIGVEGCFSCSQCLTGSVCLQPTGVQEGNMCEPLQLKSNASATAATGGGGNTSSSSSGSAGSSSPTDVGASSGSTGSSGAPSSGAASSTSTGGAGTSGSAGSSGGVGSSGGGNPTCVATLTGAPVMGTATFACAALGVVESGVQITLELNASSTISSDGGWGAVAADLTIPSSSASSIAPGIYAAGDGGPWQAVYQDPEGNAYGSFSAGIGAISFDITGVDANNDLAGTATVIIPACANGTPCDGGVLTAQYTFGF